MLIHNKLHNSIDLVAKYSPGRYDLKEKGAKEMAWEVKQLLQPSF